MSKNYRNKETCLAEAKRLGIEDADNLSWPELQKKVSVALKLEEMGVGYSADTDGDVPIDELKPATKLASKQVNNDKPSIEDAYKDKTIIISPELAPERYRLVKYDEVLGPDYEVVERKFDIDANDQVFDVSGELGDRNAIDQYHDYLTGTYRLRKRGDNKVVAMSSVPKENAGMMQRWQDVVTLVTWRGRSGYLWKHMYLPNVSDLLKQSGYYAEYKDLFKDEPNVWYAAGKQLVCDPHLVHKVLREIEEKEQRKLREAREFGWSW